MKSVARSELKFPVIVAVTVDVNLKDHKMPVCRLGSRTVQQKMAHRTTMQTLVRINKPTALLRLQQDLTKAYCFRMNNLSVISASSATL
ncbi:hypothetical protein DAPPUDRAFT_250873 [Daphnia pulex]|uniref:Uncharacterized protein n=1 Tax=Daphnia pulex TaxID=6669 RepID=E9GZF0_DAPPU|nr:hypothetical protein DAPPUDRAFT_250873 [Daphnia pulex]|eukprot:EFX75170.1 hypothetical protein DAPPUDRAFT_250873 [Daphnia pulex]